MTTRRNLIKSSLPVALATTGFFSLDSLLMAEPSGTNVTGYYSPTNFFGDGEWKLPKLPYAYDALEPHIDAQTMEIHHSKHHNAYVTNLNKALKAMSAIKPDAEPSMIESLQRDISFNMGGHALHSMFWPTLAPNAGGVPTGPLGKLIDSTFGSFDNFKSYFTKVAMSVKGSGWATLSFAPVSRQIFTSAIKDQDGHHVTGSLVLLGLDVWEHAYYLKYQNKRADYVNAWWNVVDWAAVESMYGMLGGD
ncbi:MAG TPA: superoxide dismutase [Tepidisphaeraceae bacterium]|nr:superoxide dismutase [Tepidisphaeraceae bacterium]